MSYVTFFHGCAMLPRGFVYAGPFRGADVDPDELLAEAMTDLPEPPKSAVLKRGMNYSHDGMIDLIIANPGLSQNQIAKQMGYSASWVSTVMSSDAFQARLHERAKDIIDPTLRLTVEEHFKGMLRRSIEILNHKLSKPPDEISPQLALRTFELASRAAGYGARVEQRQQVTINLETHLEDLSGNLTRLLTRHKTAVIEQESSDE
jgi:hypothetical protein